MKVFFSFLMAGLSLLLATSGFAQTKVAVVNSRQILTQCNDGMKLVKEIQDKFAARRQEADRLETLAKSLQEEIAKSGTKEARKKEIRATLAQIGGKLQQFTRDVAQEESIRFKPLVEKINSALAAYAKEKGINGIQDRANYVYVGPEMDITKDVIEKVNQMH